MHVHIHLQYVKPNPWPSVRSVGSSLGKRWFDFHDCNCCGNFVTGGQGLSGGGAQWNPNQDLVRNSVTTTWTLFLCSIKDWNLTYKICSPNTPPLFHTSELFYCSSCTPRSFSILEIKLIGYADDSTLKAVLPSPGVWVTVAVSLIIDLGRVSEWCDLWGMKLNEINTKTMTVFRSLTMHPKSHPLTIGRTVLKESDDLDICLGSDTWF